MFHQDMIFFFLQEMMGRGNRTRRKRKFFDDPEKKGNLWILFCFCSLILHSIGHFANNGCLKQGKAGGCKARRKRKI